MHFSERDFPQKFITNKLHQNQMKYMSMYKQQNHPLLHLQGLLFENGYGYNTQNLHQSLIKPTDHCVQNSEGSVNLNVSYCMETILSTESQRLRVMVFNATFNNISGISWQSVLLEKKQEYPGKTIDLSQVTDKLYHIMFTEG